MSITSDDIKNNGYIHPLADAAADEIEQLESHIAQLETDKSNAEYCFRELKKINEKLEAELAEARKDQARYKFVRGMEPEDFGNLSTYCDDFDCQVDDLMKRCKQ